MHRNEHSRLVSISGHGNKKKIYDQNTQIITEVDVKLNKWHIAVIMEKLYRKPTETERIFKYDSTVGLNHTPKTQHARTFPTKVAGNSVELV